ncbi:penicillin-binding protein 1A [Geopsychrobacter electrodiphilus]|uniref:penicillin-binding protein 1A n=1 Tax=Geopsychrobacter electrodiphilus TaxID=225196 RepID=UPI0003689FCB|nr:penicillin-binding protein 1A [Geopsychrobacter electrodiphilus]
MLSRKRIFKYLLLASLGFGLSGILGLGIAYFYVSSSLPRVETLSDYRPPLITRIYSDDGTIIAEYSRERRILVPIDKLPWQLVQAFVAAEDSNFFKHSGIDLVSILRAALKNVAAGGISQGGSTITQQVAKQLLLTSERSFSRKFKEAILAWRMEQALSKKEILYLYLNQIYLGHRAYGVEAAAENYFDKSVEQLSLAECAILAGLPQAPSRYSPYRHYKRAIARQQYVLLRMTEEGYITPAQADQARHEKVEIRPRLNTHLEETAYFNEQVRRYIEERFGTDMLYTGGLQVHTSINIAMQQAAEIAVRQNLRNHDKRQGYRGPEAQIDAADQDAFLSEQEKTLADEPLKVGSLTQALVTGGDTEKILCRIGNYNGIIDIKDPSWASPISVVARDVEASGNAEPGQPSHIPLGSLIDVEVTGMPKDGSLILALDQAPLAQGALIASTPETGQIKAMVGGYDFGESQFNRAIQAKRLPGSAIKPIIYAAALDKGYTPASVILDTPLIFEELDKQGEMSAWKPKNYEEKFYGPTSFRQALTHSRNVVTIKILEDIGVGYVANYAKKLGIKTPLTRDLTMALGSTAVTPIEMLNAYTVFANGGIRVSPSYINKIVDRNGRILESIDPADFASGMEPDQRLIRKPPRRVISKETAYLITNLMESVVQEGTGRRARVLGRPVAGKTGTTNDLKDAWFIGFIPQLACVSWVGYDQEKPLGRGETGARAAAPAWIAFMQEAIKQYPARNFSVPDAIEFYPIDEKTGKLLPDNDPQARIEAFAPGTAPTARASDEEAPKARDFFRLDQEDTF